MSEGSRPTVLVVDDEPDVVQVYTLCLSDDYSVRTATGGHDAVDQVDETVDVVLLDRRMPDLSGDEVLERIREGGYECRVAMVTAVSPDFDVVDMPFDDYVTKPVSDDELTETVERLLSLESLERVAQERFALARKRAALEAEQPERVLEASDAYAELNRRLDELEARSDRIVGEMDAEAFEAALRDLPDTDSDSVSQPGDG